MISIFIILCLVWWNVTKRLRYSSSMLHFIVLRKSSFNMIILILLLHYNFVHLVVLLFISLSLEFRIDLWLIIILINSWCALFAQNTITLVILSSNAWFWSFIFCILLNILCTCSTHHHNLGIFFWNLFKDIWKMTKVSWLIHNSWKSLIINISFVVMEVFRENIRSKHSINVRIHCVVIQVV